MVREWPREVREWICTLAWRVLWRWWPDRHYLTSYRGIGNAIGTDLVLRETALRSTAEQWVRDGRRVRERLDHAGRPVLVEVADERTSDPGDGGLPFPEIARWRNERFIAGYIPPPRSTPGHRFETVRAPDGSLWLHDHILRLRYRINVTDTQPIREDDR